MRDLLNYLKFRIKEFPVWLGIPYLGVFTTQAPISIQRLMIFTLAISLAIIHLLLLNDWGGYRRNKHEFERFKVINQPLLLKWLAYCSIASFLLSLALGALLLNIKLLLILSFCGGILSYLYSNPIFHMKENLIGSKLIHIAGGLLQFLLGYLVFSHDIQRAMLIGLYFSLLFTAGHFIHECIDINEDSKGCLNTFAGRFDYKASFYVSMALFATATYYLYFIFNKGHVDAVLFYLFCVPVLIHAVYLFRFHLNINSPYPFLVNYQKTYRLFYGLSAFIYIAVSGTQNIKLL